MTPKITIFCPTFNSIKYIDGYLENINNQVFRNFKLIFVDGGSTDGSFEKIEYFKQNSDLDIKIIQEKSSVYEAWNIAVSNVDTEYCMNFNTDDRLIPNALQIYDYYINKYPEVDLFYGMHYFISSLEILKIEEITYYWHNLINKLKNQSDSDLYFTINPCGPFPLVKTSSLIKAGKFNNKYFSSADYDMWLRMYSMKFNLKKIDEIIGYFLYRPDSVSQNRIKECEEHDKEIQYKYKYKNIS